MGKNEIQNHGAFQKGKSNYKHLDRDGDLMIVGNDLMCNLTYKNHDNIREDCDLECKTLKFCHEIITLLEAGQPQLANDVLEIVNK